MFSFCLFAWIWGFNYEKANIKIKVCINGQALVQLAVAKYIPSYFKLADEM
jgi:hypothetical protein